MFQWLVRFQREPKFSRWGVLAALTAALGAAFLWAQEMPTIRVNVNLVRVVATVRNKSGELMGKLQKEDFQVLDNGAPQEIAVFAHQTDQPLSVALLVDTSGSTAKELKYEGDSALKFLHALLSEGNPSDAVALYTFDYDITQHNFTHNYASLERDLKMLHGEGGSSIYDAIYFASRALQNREGRKVIIIVTDGGDTTSARDSKAALKEAQLSDAVIYAVVVMPITNDAGRNIGGENILTYMAQRTGGKTFPQTSGTQLDKTFADIIAELRTQYLLGFYPHNVPLSKDPYHKLEVHMKAPDLQVSTRSGYYGEAEGASGAPGGRISVTPDRDRKKEPIKK
ncbi:MAG TPA: VWA domain-containing protein [Bryobacteraceae bacterium]|nr:VWA domain-containing protein [Bryobacteraceae bacterium]